MAQLPTPIPYQKKQIFLVLCEQTMFILISYVFAYVYLGV